MADFKYFCIKIIIVDNISVVIISFNEEKNIERCLSSLCGISDDIVVVDSGSEDKTEEICLRYNCRFFFRKFDDYSSQKNFANSLTKNDYILSIDADECLSDELCDSIKKLKPTDNNFAISFNRLNHYGGKPVRYCGWYPDRKTRIWNRKFAKWEGIIHEKIIFTVNPVTILLKGDLLHYTYNNKQEHIKQAKKFAILNAESDLKKGKKTSLHKFIFLPIFRFCTIYFFKLGFLDGKTGFFIAKISAHATFLRYRKFY